MLRAPSPSPGVSRAVLDFAATPEGLLIHVEGRDEPLRLVLAPNGVLKGVPLPKDNGVDQDTAPRPVSMAEMMRGIDQA